MTHDQEKAAPQTAISPAAKAMVEGDIVEMLKAYQALKDFKS